MSEFHYIGYAQEIIFGPGALARLIKPKAFVVLKKDPTPSDQLAQALIEHCQQAMAAYKRPRWIEFVDELPRTATGKIQRVKLRA
jgi:acyl-coenzyme A synthetase/AMP-(fatty) acid ligase